MTSTNRIQPTGGDDSGWQLLACCDFDYGGMAVRSGEIPSIPPIESQQLALDGYLKPDLQFGPEPDLLPETDRPLGDFCHDFIGGHGEVATWLDPTEPGLPQRLDFSDARVAPTWTAGGGIRNLARCLADLNAGRPLRPPAPARRFTPPKIIEIARIQAEFRARMRNYTFRGAMWQLWTVLAEGQILLKGYMENEMASGASRLGVLGWDWWANTAAALVDLRTGAVYRRPPAAVGRSRWSCIMVGALACPPEKGTPGSTAKAVSRARRFMESLMTGPGPEYLKLQKLHIKEWYCDLTRNTIEDLSETAFYELVWKVVTEQRPDWRKAGRPKTNP